MAYSSSITKGSEAPRAATGWVWQSMQAVDPLYLSPALGGSALACTCRPPEAASRQPSARAATAPPAHSFLGVHGVSMVVVLSVAKLPADVPELVTQAGLGPRVEAPWAII